MRNRLSLLLGALVLSGWSASFCFAQTWGPTSGVYVYGPPTAGQSTSVFHYPKSWRGPRYSYPQAYYFKFPPFRRPVKFHGMTPYLDQTFFTGATTNAEIWAIRRKGEVSNLPASARVPLPAQTRLAPTIGPLPKRPLSPATFERRRPPIQRRDG
ncbi:MAG: hypothetical protein ACREHD_19710 [Pirellulales bacterium]